MYGSEKELTQSLLSLQMPYLFSRKLILITWNLTSWATQDKSLNLSLPLLCWSPSVMVTHLDNGGLSEPWYMTLGPVELPIFWLFMNPESSNLLFCLGSFLYYTFCQPSPSTPASPRAWHLCTDTSILLSHMSNSYSSFKTPSAKLVWYFCRSLSHPHRIPSLYSYSSLYTSLL